MEQGLLFNSDDSVSKVISKMYLQNKSEAILLKKGKFFGVINVRDISKRKINDPHAIKIRKFSKKSNIMPYDTDLNTLIKSILKSNTGFVVIEKSKKYYILTKLDILSKISNRSIFKQTKAVDIMSSPFCLSLDDSISTGMSLIRDLNISVLPVLNHKEGAEGFVDTSSLLKAETDRKRTKFGEKSGEHIRLREVKITSLMSKNFPRTNQNTSTESLIKLMVNKNRPFVFIEDKNKLRGIVTVGDIIRLLGEKKPEAKEQRFGRKGLYLALSGIHDEDPFIKNVLEEEISNELRKLSRIIPIESVVINVSRHHKTGKRTKYSVKAKILTQRGDFFADDFSWDLTKAMRGILKKFEKEIIRKKEKRRVYTRAP